MRLYIDGTHTHAHKCIVKPFRSNSTRFDFLTFTRSFVACICYASALAFYLVYSFVFVFFFACYCCCCVSPFRSLIRYFRMLHHSNWMHVNARICNSLIVAIWFIICFYCYSTMHSLVHVHVAVIVVNRICFNLTVAFCSLAFAVTTAAAAAASIVVILLI